MEAQAVIIDEAALWRTFVRTEADPTPSTMDKDTMKTPLRLAVAAFALALASAPAQAQPPGGRGGNPQEMMARQRERLFEGITLTDAQKVQVDTLYAQQLRRQQELMQGGMGPDMRERMQAMRAEHNEAIRKVLTKEQVEQFEKNLAAMPQGRRPPGSR